MDRVFHVWSNMLGGPEPVKARDLRDAIAQVGNRGPKWQVTGASEPNRVDLAAAQRSESALESALRERGWRPTTPLPPSKYHEPVDRMFDRMLGVAKAGFEGMTASATRLGDATAQAKTGFESLGKAMGKRRPWPMRADG
jgi:hypothetical protein